MIQAATLALSGYRNAAFQTTINLLQDGVAPNLTGYTFKMQIKAAPGAAGAALLSLLSSSSSPNTRIDASQAASGVLGIIATETDISSIPAPSPSTANQTLFYDIIGTDSNSIPYNLCGGMITLSPGVTTVP